MEEPSVQQLSKASILCPDISSLEEQLLSIVFSKCGFGQACRDLCYVTLFQEVVKYLLTLDWKPVIDQSIDTTKAQFGELMSLLGLPIGG